MATPSPKITFDEMQKEAEETLKFYRENQIYECDEDKNCNEGKLNDKIVKRILAKPKEPSTVHFVTPYWPHQIECKKKVLGSACIFERVWGSPRFDKVDLGLFGSITFLDGSVIQRRGKTTFGSNGGALFCSVFTSDRDRQLTCSHVPLGRVIIGGNASLYNASGISEMKNEIRERAGLQKTREESFKEARSQGKSVFFADPGYPFYYPDYDECKK